MNTYTAYKRNNTGGEPRGLTVRGPLSPARWKGISTGQMLMEVTAGGQVHLLSQDANHDSQAVLSRHLQIGKTFSPALGDVGSSVDVTAQLRETDMCLLHTGFLCNTTEPVTTSPVWTGTGSSIINKVCFQCVVGCSGPVLSTCWGWPSSRLWKCTLNQAVKPCRVPAFWMSNRSSPHMVSRSEICTVLMSNCNMVHGSERQSSGFKI